jgi:hypothetical protein
MPIEGDSLQAVSRQFCERLNRLLAKTISQQRLIALATFGPLVNISFRQAGPDRIAQTAKLRTRFGEMGLFVGFICGATQVKRTTVRLYISQYKYTLTPKGSTDPLWRWEYLREWPGEDDRYCRHHVQGDIPVSIARRRLSLNDLHLPTGYVALEDIIRFCLVDLRARRLSTDWHKILQESYQQFKQERAEFQL